MSDIRDRLDMAMDLPQRYASPNPTNMGNKIKPVVAPNQIFEVDGKSAMPVFMINDIGQGLAIIAFNRETKKAAAMLCPSLEEADAFVKNGFARMLGNLRKPSSGDKGQDHSKEGPHAQKIEVYIIGCSQYDLKPSIYDNLRKGYGQVRDLKKVIDAMRWQDFELKTFDVYGKPKPNSVAFNAESGLLISYSKFFKSLAEIKKSPGWHKPPNERDR